LFHTIKLILFFASKLTVFSETSYLIFYFIISIIILIEPTENSFVLQQG